MLLFHLRKTTLALLVVALVGMTAVLEPMAEARHASIAGNQMRGGWYRSIHFIWDTEPTKPYHANQERQLNFCLRK